MVGGKRTDVALLDCKHAVIRTPSKIADKADPKASCDVCLDNELTAPKPKPAVGGVEAKLDRALGLMLNITRENQRLKDRLEQLESVVTAPDSAVESGTPETDTSSGS